MKKLLIILFALSLLLPTGVFGRQTQLLQKNLFTSPNLLAYYPLSNVNDYKSTNNLTQTGGSFDAGIFFNAFDSGTSGQAQHLDYNALIGGLAPMTATAYSFNFWVNTSVVPANNTAAELFEYSDLSTANHEGYVEIQYYNNNGAPQLYIDRRSSASGDQYGVNYTLTIGQWYMMTFTYDGSNIYLYLNGSSTPIVSGASTQTGSTGTGGATVTGLHISKFSAGSREFWGKTDDFQVYNSVLTSSQMANLYTSMSLEGNGISR